MRLYKRVVLALIAACLIFASIAHAETTMSDLKLVALDATSIEASWTGDPADAVVVDCRQAGALVTTAPSLKSNPSIFKGLIPNTTYTITAKRLSDGMALTGVVKTPEAPPYRENGFRWNTCRVYSSTAKASEGFWDASRKRLDKPKQSELALLTKQRALIVVLEYWCNATKTDKHYDALLVLRTPSGMVFTDKWMNETVNKSWKGVVDPYPVYQVFEDSRIYLKSIEAGDYQIEFYFDGQFAGKTEFTVLPD